MSNLCTIISGSGLRDEVNVIRWLLREQEALKHSCMEWETLTPRQCSVSCWYVNVLTVSHRNVSLTDFANRPFILRMTRTGVVAACSRPLQSIFVLSSADPHPAKHPKTSNSLAKLQKVTRWRASNGFVAVFILTFIINVTVRWSHTCIASQSFYWDIILLISELSITAFCSSMKLISAVTLLNIDTVAWLTFSGSINTQRPTPAAHPAHPHVSSACQLASRLGMKSSYSCWAPAADEFSAGVCNCNAIPPRRVHAVRAWSAAEEEEG